MNLRRVSLSALLYGIILSIPLMAGDRPSAPQYNRNSHQTVIQIPGTNQRFTLSQLKAELQRGGLALVKNNHIRPGQATILYTNANSRNPSAEFGLLVTSTQIGDNVEMNTVALHGRCDGTAGSGGVGADCEAGVFNQDVYITHNGGTSKFNVKGPTASGCGSVTQDKLCANAGADLASTSYTITDDHGNGIGIGVSAGIGAGLSGDYEDGIISGSINLKFVAGGSIAFSVNAKEAGKTLLKAGKAGYVLARRKIVGASNQVARAFSRQLPNVARTTGKAVLVTGQGAVHFIDASFRSFGNAMNQTFKPVVKETKQWVKNATQGKKSRKLNQGEGYISVFNQAGFVTKVTTKYSLNGKQYKDSKKISAGYTKQFYFPPGARNITLNTKGVATMKKLKMKLSFASLSGMKKCYKVWGTIFKPKWGSIDCR